MHPLVNIGIKAARLAGNVILKAQDKIDELQIVQKGRNDFASQVDKAAEEIIIQTIKKAYPYHGILGEETGLTQSTDRNDITWIIDPLDGTTNFLHGFPQFCVSIGVKHQDKILHGIVYDPIRDELFTASRGEGARLNDRKLRVSTNEKLENALLGTGFPFRDFEQLDPYLKLLAALLPQCAGIRRAGAAALDLAYVAAGRLDGFWEFDLKIWDIAAGALLIQEAGGYVTTLDGSQDFLQGDSILAAPPKIYKELLKISEQYIRRG